MIINERRTEQIDNKINCKGQELEKVTTYEYLGLMIAINGEMDVEIANRIKKAKRICYYIN